MKKKKQKYFRFDFKMERRVFGIATDSMKSAKQLALGIIIEAIARETGFQGPLLSIRRDLESERKNNQQEK